ncbi:MAG TPA: CsbD family protein [Sporichthyaceae bacterium]|jgi:uncharacterized protein YjbJ (UPF0337 family)|nr:CsbD family protein [Sporichthyaceae bacterium]
MGAQDKISNQAQDLGGRAKEELGEMTGDPQMGREGRADQAKAAMKDVGESMKDAAEKVGETAKDAAHKVKDAVTGHHR